jgi:hypothetical protein
MSLAFVRKGVACIGAYSASHGNEGIFFFCKISDNLSFALISVETTNYHQTTHMGLFQPLTI